MSTVYIVDDDASVLDSTALMLQLGGWNARTFSSGESFVAESNHDWEGCLLIDFNLGSMTAAEVIRRIRAASIGLPAIVLSSESPDVIRPLVAELGAVEILEKPASQRELEAAVRRALNR